MATTQTPQLNNDSPLSITSSIAGILTFIVAILAALYVRLTYLRNADTEYFQVKSSLSWYKTESTWMQDLINEKAADGRRKSFVGGERGGDRENEMYGFVMEELGRLEERLLECLAEAEEGVSKSEVDEKGNEKGWTIVPGRLRGRTDIAMSWLPVRAKALELVRQRDALGNRVLFAQMSLISSRVKDQETKTRKREERRMERLERLENLVYAQSEKMDRLEDLVYRAMHQDRVRNGAEPKSPKYEERYPENGGIRTPVPKVDYSDTERNFNDLDSEASPGTTRSRGFPS